MTLDVSRRQFLRGTAGALALGAIAAQPAIALAGPGLPRADAYPATTAVGWTRFLYAQVKAERLLPPVAARAYSYLGVAAWEAVTAGSVKALSLSGQLNDLPTISTPPGQVHWPLAVNSAVARTLAGVLSDRSESVLAAVAARAAEVDAALSGGLARPIAERSRAHGDAVGSALAARTARDGYLATRNLPYTPPEGPSAWVRTPPNFGAAIEPHWGRTTSWTLRSNDELKPAPPVAFSHEEGSEFWLQAKTVYDAVNALDDERRLTALFWRDNPDGSTGLPSGHWMLTACTVIEQLEMRLDRAAEVLALLGVAVADGFTSCWTEKYETNLLRPVTYIQRVIDPAWASFVNSPAFPEYTSGHSVGSGAAATVLTALLGTVSYVDDVGEQNGYGSRRFNSFWEAAEEAATSRLLGGIHYPMAIEVGLEQGTAVGQTVLSRVRTRR